MNDKLSQTRWWVGIILLLSALSIGSYGLATSENYEKESIENLGDNDLDDRRQRNTSFPTVLKQDELYVEECGSCHMAYPGGLLPQQSWYVIMTELDKHFGENAELDEETVKQITEFLALQAIDKNKPYSMRKLLKRVPLEAPRRITELPYFVKEHNEIPKRMVIENQQVNSLSQCDSCHKDAIKGDFNEDRVVIPGFGSWDD